MSDKNHLPSTHDAINDELERRKREINLLQIENKYNKRRNITRLLLNYVFNAVESRVPMPPTALANKVGVFNELQIQNLTLILF